MSDASIASDAVSKSRSDQREPRASAHQLAAGDWQPRVAALWRSIEDQLSRASEWFNPILVKETRQALRSWNFSVTFLLMLVACWIVTMGGVAMIGPSIYYAAGGGFLLRGYYFILSLPLLVVVPFGAFRSLAAEREDNTYDLLSITTLGPRQIIGGKLTSAVVQMVMYYSAITPCLAFTYLLRGVDAPSIALLLTYTFFASLALSTLGLLLAALSRQKYGQLVLSIALVAILLNLFGFAQFVAGEIVGSGFEWYDEANFWIGNLFCGAIYATSMALAFYAAAAMIAAPSENRSTSVRIAMLAQQAAIVAAFAWAWIASNYDPTFPFVMAMAGGCYWFALGTILNGEQPEMSNRVMRGLPQSALGRLFFTWLQPGPASGYMFAVANLTSILILSLLAMWFAAPSNALTLNRQYPDGFATLALLGGSYVVAYLGLGLLVVSLLRRFSDVSMFAGVLIHLLLVLAGIGIPISIQRMSLELRNEAYSFLQVSNPIWTLEYLRSVSPAPEESVLLVLVAAAAACMLLLNLPAIVRELKRVRATLPARVAEDELQLHPPPESLPQNPWEADA